VDEPQPANTTEELLITEMAQSHWLAQRAIRLQNDCWGADGIDTKRLALFLRYQTTHQRAFHKALNVLIALQKRKGHGCAQLNKEGTHERLGSAPVPCPSCAFLKRLAEKRELGSFRRGGRARRRKMGSFRKIHQKRVYRRCEPRHKPPNRGWC
jgi:hypothetical protein